MEKSPAVQPIRQRKVLIPARFHVALQVQNGSFIIDGGLDLDAGD